MASEDLYLGFDLSTQQLKAIIINSSLKLIHEAKVDFDQDFGQKYGITKGVLRHDDLGEIFSPVAMWLEAIDLVLTRLQEQGLDFSKVKGLSGAGMQHGTVFWNKDAERLLQHRDGSKTLLESLEQAFSSPHSPNWQDASTQSQCEEFDALLGSPEKLAEVTGSKAHHRFSGPQIMRLRQRFPDRYAATARISIVSSFISSIFLDHVAPIDIGDVCGMNLWNISKECWDDRLLSLVAGGEDKVAHLKGQLGEVSHDGGATLGQISPYFVDRYGFPQDCKIIAATGDNPATILSLPLQPSDAIVSLGTSTTFLMSTPNYNSDPQYHFMNHPTTKGLYMFMLCYKNGGLAREHVRDSLNSATKSSERNTWQQFNEEAFEAPLLNQNGEADSMKLGLYFPLPEIVPTVKRGIWRCLYRPYNKSDHRPRLEFLDDHPFYHDDSDDQTQEYTEADARTILESQFLSLRLRSKNLVTPQTDPKDQSKSLPPQPRRIYLVGGGSINPIITQICGEVLGGSEGVYRLDVGGNACALGAAHKAVWGCERAKDEKFEDFIGSRWNEDEFVKRVDVGYREGVWEKYEVALRGFEEMEREVVKRAGVDLKVGKKEQVVGTRKD